MSSRKFPYSISKVEGDLGRRMLRDFPGLAEGIVQVGPEKWTMPAVFEEYADQIYNFEARPDDIWITTVPRSGTTWTQEMIWLMCNNLDYERALSTPIDVRFPYLEFHTLMSETTLATFESTLNKNEFAKFKSRFAQCYGTLSGMKSRRLIKTHFPISLMPRSVKEVGAKIVYVARNPKDMCVSWYHMHKSFPGYGFTGDFKSFSEYFMDDLTLFTPYWKHVLEGWQHRHQNNVHFMFYEDCKADLDSSLKKLAEFLGHPLNDEDLPRLKEHLKFENMKNNSSINFSPDPIKESLNFVRRGEVGGNPELTPELSAKFDVWAKKNLASTDFQFPIEI